MRSQVIPTIADTCSQCAPAQTRGERPAETRWCAPQYADARRNSSKTLAHPETTVLARPSTSTKREIADAFQDTADAGCIQRPLETGSAVPTRFVACLLRRETHCGRPVSTTTPRKSTSQDRRA